MSVNEYLFWSALVILTLVTISEMWRSRAEKVRKEAERKTEERIIILLEDLYPIRYPKSITTGGGEGELITEIIALIKGENK